MNAKDLSEILKKVAVEWQPVFRASVRLSNGGDLPIDEFSLGGRDVTEHELCVHMLQGILGVMPSMRCRLYMRCEPEYDRVADETETSHRLYTRLAWEAVK